MESRLFLPERQAKTPTIVMMVRELTIVYELFPHGAILAGMFVLGTEEYFSRSGYQD